jgi:hypothetical protein
MNESGWHPNINPRGCLVGSPRHFRWIEAKPLPTSEGATPSHSAAETSLQTLEP